MKSQILCLTAHLWANYFFGAKSQRTSFDIGGLAVGECYAGFPNLTERFSWEQLEFFCQRQRANTEFISGLQNRTDVTNPFTDAQATYLQSLISDLKHSPGGNSAKFRKTLRKEIRMLSDGELTAFIWALKSLKLAQIDGISKYDLLVILHHPALAPGAHVGAAFLPWHREYLTQFERALQLENPSAVLPYWDSTLDQGLPNPVQSVVWSDAFFGTPNGPVKSGPARKWYFKNNNFSDSLILTRAAGVLKNSSLLTPSLEEFFLSKTKYTDLTACKDLTVEQANRYLHQWVGGTMAAIYYSPQDFLYFLHAAFIDYLWEEFRAKKQSKEERVNDYPLDHEACTKFHQGDSVMRPFAPLINIDGLSATYTSRFYTYQPRPNCASENPDCGSPHLFCHISENERPRCLSRIRYSGDCTGFTGDLHTAQPCVQPYSCIQNVCQAS